MNSTTITTPAHSWGDTCRAYWALICLLIVPMESGTRWKWLAAMTLLLGAGIFLLWRLPSATDGAATVPLAVACYTVLCGGLSMWLMTAVGAAIRLNRPELANLAPRMRSRLLRTCAILSALVISLSTAAISLRVGHVGLVLAASCLLIAGLLLAFRDSVVVVVMPMLVFFFDMCTGFTTLDHAASLVARLDQPVVVAVASLVLGLALLRVFPRGGDAHWTWHARMLTAASAGRGRLWNWRPGVVPSVRRATKPGTAAAITMLQALGPKLHASAYMIVALMVATVTSLLPAAGRLGGNLQAVMIWSGWAQLLIFCMPLLFVHHARVALAQRYGEQALYRLAPGAPAVAVFNRVLARALLTRFLLLWLVAFGCALTLMREIWPGFGNHAMAPVLAAATLPFAGALLTNMAALPRELLPGRTFAGAVGLLGTYGFVLSVAGKSHDFPWFALSGVIGVASLVFLRWRWLRMITMAPAFPAGRMAS